MAAGTGVDDGVILVDKPAGVTSHDVVAQLRRVLGRRRIGHAGTLDPFATGLLLVLVGRATRVQRFLMALPKTYFAVARFGAVSSTGDPEGVIRRTGTPPPAELHLPTGRRRQRPPAYSAVHVAGERAYRLARRGQAVELPEREIELTRFELRWRSGERVGLEIECSSGTYVRALVAELGDAYCEQLRRTRIGPFEVERADPARILSIDEALSFVPAVALAPELARAASHGRAVPAPASVQGVVRLRDEHGLVALAQTTPPPRAASEPADSWLRPVVGFRP